MDLRIFAILLTVASFASAGAPNIFCLTIHCLSAVTSCKADTTCNKGLDCLQKCKGTDRPCLTSCMNSYGGTALDNFLNCAATKHSCVKVVHKDNVECKTPNTVGTFDTASLLGRWKMIRGMHSVADCFDCHEFVFERDSNSRQYSVQKTFDVLTVEGHHRQRTFVDSVEQKADGQLYLTGMRNGLRHSETWHILAASKNYIYAYYCANTAGAVYDGSRVLAITDTLSDCEMEDITEAAGKNGFNMASHCSPRTSNCHVSN